MKTVLSALALTVVASAFAMGCSNESSGPVDTDSAIASFQNPTGSFDKSSGADAFSGFKNEKSESGKVSQPDGKSGVGTQSIRLLSHTLDAKTSCSEGQSCACESGGSFTYQLEESKAGKAARFQFNKCMGADNTGFDGSAVILVTTQSILGITEEQAAPAKGLKAGSKSKTGQSSGSGEGGLKGADYGSSADESAANQNLLFAAKGTAIEGQKKTELEFAMIHEAGYLLLAVQVKDGKIVIGVAPNGNAFVKAKQGTWLCAPSSSKGYQCKSENGEDLELDDAETQTGDEDSAGSDTGSDTGSSDVGDDEEIPSDEGGEGGF